MSELSPAALAVWATYLDHSEMDETPADLPALAAALRVAADYAQRSSYAAAPSTDWGDGWKAGVFDTANGLLAIADELEGAR